MNLDALRKYCATLPGATRDVKWGADLVPAPYLARAHWVQLRDPTALTHAAARELVSRSRALVLAKLPRRMQAAISASPAPTVPKA